MCSCNDDSTLSNCRWEEWTCTKDSSSHSCFSRLKRLDDGSIRRDLGCMNILWNPDFCGRVSETVATECCNQDFCNDNLTPTFLQPTIISTAQSPSSPTATVGSPQPTHSSSINGSGAPTFSPSSILAPTPTHTLLSNDITTGWPASLIVHHNWCICAKAVLGQQNFTGILRNIVEPPNKAQGGKSTDVHKGCPLLGVFSQNLIIFRYRSSQAEYYALPQSVA